MQSRRSPMRILASAALALFFVAALPAFAYTHAHRGPTAPNLFKKRSRAGVHSSAKPVGPRAIDSERATQIQAALIKSGYLSGTPSGRWDAESQSAMQKLQGDRGWQTKLTPDSRALIMLGLGPNTAGNGEEVGALAQSNQARGEAVPAAGSRLESTFASQQ